MDGSFKKDLIDFIGRRIEAARMGLKERLEMPEETYAGLNDEERANAKEAVERDAIYLQGLADGLRLLMMVSDKESGHV